MKCIKCHKSFTNTSSSNESNRYGRKYKVLTHNLLDFLKNPQNRKNIKNYIQRHCICIPCFNEYYKNNTIQYIDPNDACYFCWNKKKNQDKNQTLCCDKCQRYIAQIDEQGLINLVIDSLKSRNSKLFDSASTDFVYHNDDFYIDTEIKLDCVINQKLKHSNSVIEFDSNNHSSYPYEEEKTRSIKTQKYFKEKDIDCLYMRFGWKLKIDTDELQKSLIILFDYLILKLLYPTFYGFIIIGYPMACKRVLDFRKDWNLLCSPFLATNKRPYLDWDYNDQLLNSYNSHNKIFDRLHVIYDNKKIIELFKNKEDRYLISTSFLSEFLNDGSINLEKVLSLEGTFFIINDSKIVKIKSIEPFEQIGISSKKFKFVLEILTINDTNEMNIETIEYSYCDIKILKKKIDNFVNDFNKNNLLINNQYKINSLNKENKITVNSILQYEMNIHDIFNKKLFSKNDDIEQINSICLDIENMLIDTSQKRKRKRSLIDMENNNQNKKKKQDDMDIETEHLQNLSADPLSFKEREWQGGDKNLLINSIKKYYRDKISCIQCLNDKNRKAHNRNDTCCHHYLNLYNLFINIKDEERFEYINDIKMKYQNKIKCIQCIHPLFKTEHNRDETCYLHYYQNNGNKEL